MSEEKKTLLAEILPAPTVIEHPRWPSPRSRVLSHLRSVRRFGAVVGAAGIAGCGLCVMDPPPPPAECTPLNAFDVTATAFGNQTGVVTTVTADPQNWHDPSALWRLGDPEMLTGAALSRLERFEDPSMLRMNLAPDAGALQVQFEVGATCSDGEFGGGVLRVARLRVTIDLVSQVDGGTDGGEDAGNPFRNLDVRVEFL